jgi:GrpB-like predicted nucleotidyltransferase (UPF0157 family)
MPVAISQHDPAWAERFARERAVLEPVLQPWLDGGIHHIGSTAVPGLAAKPIVDILAGVADVQAARAAIPLLADLGYRLWDDRERPWRLWFLKPEPARRTHHLQLLEPSRPEFQALLAFRNRLRSEPRLRADYEGLKRRLAERHRHDREAYTDGKTEFVRRAG